MTPRVAKYSAVPSDCSAVAIRPNPEARSTGPSAATTRARSRQQSSYGLSIEGGPTMSARTLGLYAGFLVAISAAPAGATPFAYAGSNVGGSASVTGDD